jgi:hypothetical protein
MASVWVESLGRSFDQALDLLESAVRDCPEELWESNLWDVPASSVREVRGSDGALTSDPAAIEALLPLLQREGTPWGVAWHALERLDFILTGGFVPWEVWPPLAARIASGSAAALPPAPGFEGRHTGLDLTTLTPPWTREEVTAYLAYCRQRVHDTLGELTDELAARPVGAQAQPYASRLMRMPLHVVEHGSQIRQFLTSAAR